MCATTYVDAQSRFVTALRNQDSSAVPLPCPYCPSDTTFELLWAHVTVEHASEIATLDPNEARTTVQNLALNLRKSGQSLDATAGGGSTPDITGLSIASDKERKTSPPPKRKRPADSDHIGRKAPTSHFDVVDSDFPGDIPYKIVSDQTKPRQRDDRFGYKKGIRRIASPNLSTKVNKPTENQFQNTTEWPVSTDPHVSKQPSQQPGFGESPKYDSRYPGLLLQPDSRPISQEQLASEVKSIYAGLIMVETKCIEVDKTLANARKENSGQVLTSEHWQALIALHRTLLHEHHDFFLASQHPSASPALRRLAAKYGMPGRMWRIGIHPFLEELRLRLPVDDQDPQDTRDHMIAFIYLCYQMVALLYETVPAFEYTWIECLGDLGRYRMAIDKDIREYEAWANVSRSWYSKAADKTPTVGRLSHHLATLARSSSLQQLYYYSKSLVAVEPFEGSRQSITGTLNTACGRAPVPTYMHAAPVDESFVRAHASLFERNEKENHDAIQFEFTEQLDNHIGRMTGAWKDHGVYIAVTNITGWFGYGIGLNILREAFLIRLSQMSAQEHTSTQQPSTSAAEHQKYPAPTINKQDVTSGLSALASDLIFSKAQSLTYDTLALVLRRIGDKHVLPHVHVILSFFSSIASGENVAHLIDHAPWVELTTFLNTLIKTETQQNRINNIDAVLSKPVFPTGGKNNRGDELPLPEDYMIRGLIWAPVYFTANWFDEEIDEEEKYLEPASTTRTRTERILRLGLRLSSFNRWIAYNKDAHTFTVIGC